ncbi:dTDP-4-dehydrorhamnose 3,5-epimerase [Oribacterium sp. P9]|uniref:dTDP-4-dehydrorhamnose 3,5-epimerase n=1 Tax=unclassified Oribacterium TaxID=2629782 RepID=UPI003070F22A|nr:dTDP-4-dehydrorhamnose 3,5-epimerase [Oribacterium sp.]MDD6519465.1 dTDP-4-dehydrorhamnose 3,5-epimerase [Oribacterium sp.]
MGQIKVTKAPIEGLYVIEPSVHGDARGYFMETYNQKDMHEAGLDMVFVQDNQSMSTKGVLRGLHFQKQYPQGKLVRVIKGSVYDVAVDLREGSPTYGQYYGVELTEENKKQFYISEGFAHGFLVLSDVAEFCYKVTDFWHPGDESGLAWNDPEINIQWPQLRGTYPGSASAEGYTLEDGTPLNLSDKDQKWLGLKDTFHFSSEK